MIRGLLGQDFHPKGRSAQALYLPGLSFNPVLFGWAEVSRQHLLLQSEGTTVRFVALGVGLAILSGFSETLQQQKHSGAAWGTCIHQCWEQEVWGVLAQWVIDAPGG